MKVSGDNLGAAEELLQLNDGSVNADRWVSKSCPVLHLSVSGLSMLQITVFPL